MKMNYLFGTRIITCFTLRRLELVDGYLDHPAYPAIEPTTAAFILRHLPFLEKLDCCTGTERAVQLLHKETEAIQRSVLKCFN